MWRRCTHAEMTSEQEYDLIHLCSNRKSGIAASRGYGKTLLACIIESFLASHHWIGCHIFKTTNQATQWYEWFRKMGWRRSQWHATYGNYIVYLRIYAQGRGPRMDYIFNDEVGTVISDIERADFSASQEMLAGSPLGFVKYMGTRDPNSLWSKYEQCLVLRPYNPETMPWAVMQYEDAKTHNSPAYMDCEYHMKATAAGGLILTKTHIIANTDRITHRFGIDPNPVHGLYVVGSHVQGMEIYLTEAYCFNTLDELSDFILSRPECPFELEMNGVGGVVAMFLRSKGAHYIECWTDDHIKVDRCVFCAVRDIYIPKEYEFDVLPVLTKQIWDGKKVMKFNDAHWFDAFWLSVGVNTTGYLAAGPMYAPNQSILKREAMRN
jgi:hypothetical protein